MALRYRYDFDETWGYWHHPGVAGDTGTVCDWSAVRPGTLDMPSCFKKTCGGHNADDVLPFEVRVRDCRGADMFCVVMSCLV